MQMLLRQGEMDGWMDKERKKDVSQVAQTFFFSFTFLARVRVALSTTALNLH